MYEDEWGDYIYYEEPRRSIDGMMLAGIGILVLFAFHILRSVLPSGVIEVVDRPVADQRQPTAITAVENTTAVTQVEAAPLTPGQIEWHLAVQAPYAEYIVTQGPHGTSYGHYAIDIAAGKGEPILSPINGSVVQRYIDQWNNTIIVIANDIYEVTMYHGDYWLEVGAAVQMGQQIGTESNKGYTLDMQGRSCAGRDCGYHTHLNIFDKRIGANINPLDVIGR